MNKSFIDYESNYIQLYDKMNILEKLLGTSKYIFLDHIGTSNKFYGLAKCKKYGVKLKIISEDVYKNAPEYKFYKVKIPARSKRKFLSAMKKLKYHMIKVDDNKYFDIMNKFLVHLWINGQFKNDPNTENIDRINKSLKASNITNKDDILAI